MANFKIMAKIYRFKQKIIKNIETLNKNVEFLEKIAEKRKNPTLFLKKLKQNYHGLKKEQKRILTIKRSLKNRKSIETNILYKIENGIEFKKNEEELANEIYKIIYEEHQQKVETNLYDALVQIQQIEPNFDPNEFTTYEILKGDSLGKKLLNIDLIRIPEAIFEPSIYNFPFYGLNEVVEEIKPNNVFLTGGLTQIKNLPNRIENLVLLNRFSRDSNCVTISDNPTMDSLYGMTYSDYFPTFNRKEYEECGINYLLKNKQKKFI